MAVLLVRDDRFLAHDPGPGHPEAPARLAAIHADLDARPIAGTRTVPATAAPHAALARVHRAPYLDVLAGTAGRRVWLDPDTITSAGSWDAARHAAGASLDATRAVLAGEASGAFALVRPPGHHAEPDAAMGFCLLDNVAIAAAAAVDEEGLERVLVLDPDVHHGNGTQRAFWTRADVLYVSSHRYPFYPGTGAAGELGAGEGLGRTINLPLPAETTDADLLHVYEHVVAPVVHAFAPQLILVSAGFDTWQGDPIGGWRVTEAGFTALAGLFRRWADEHCPGRVVHVLEGGYAAGGLVAGVRATVEVLTGARGRATRVTGAPGPAPRALVASLVPVLRPLWPEARFSAPGPRAG